MKGRPARRVHHGFRRPRLGRLSPCRTRSTTWIHSTDWSTPNHVGEMNLWAGRTWYRKDFHPAGFDARQEGLHRIRGGASSRGGVSQRQAAGRQQDWFHSLRIRLDLRTAFRRRQKNVIAVMADNTFTQETDMAKIIKTDLPWNSPPLASGAWRHLS